jgi:branched-subunit amino acid aminotransferase/4-amino-4-deoxychorismate lyase
LAVIIALVHDLVSHNGHIVASSDVRIAALSAAGLYGKGVFTTIAIYDAEKDWWYEHWLRLSRDSEKLGIDISTLNVVDVGKRDR